MQCNYVYNNIIIHIIFCTTMIHYAKTLSISATLHVMNKILEIRL